MSAWFLLLSFCLLLLDMGLRWLLRTKYSLKRSPFPRGLRVLRHPRRFVRGSQLSLWAEELPTSTDSLFLTFPVTPMAVGGALLRSPARTGQCVASNPILCQGLKCSNFSHFCQYDVINQESQTHDQQPANRSCVFGLKSNIYHFNVLKRTAGSSTHHSPHPSLSSARSLLPSFIVSTWCLSP